MEKLFGGSNGPALCAHMHVHCVYVHSYYYSGPTYPTPLYILNYC